MTNIGVMTALYVVMTLLCMPLAYGNVQFRVSELLVLFCFFNKDYIFSMTLGCFLANLFSPMGMADAAFGTAATLIAVVLIYFTRKKVNLFVASLYPVVSNGIIVGLELKFIMGLGFLKSAAFVALGEFVCVSILGVLVVGSLTRNKGFMKLIMAGIDTKDENK